MSSNKDLTLEELYALEMAGARQKPERSKALPKGAYGDPARFLEFEQEKKKRKRNKKRKQL